MKVATFHPSIDDFIVSLEEATQSKVFRYLDLLEKLGYGLRPPYSKQIMSNLFELRIRGVQEVRILYTFYNDVAVLLHGFVKKSEKIPKNDIELAAARKRALDSL